MLFRLLKSIVMILPQSTCYHVLKDRLTSVARFRQSSGANTTSHTRTLSQQMQWAFGSGGGNESWSTNMSNSEHQHDSANNKTSMGWKSSSSSYQSRLLYVRSLHCAAAWERIQSDRLQQKEANGNDSNTETVLDSTTTTASSKQEQSTKTKQQKQGTPTASRKENKKEQQERWKNYWSEVGG